MLQHTEHEKQLIKEAKKAYKKQQHSENLKEIEFQNKQIKQSLKIIRTGIMEGEEILHDEYSVHFDYYYVVSDDGGKVVRSDVRGTVLDLKKYLQSLGYKAEQVYNCEMMKRNIF